MELLQTIVERLRSARLDLSTEGATQRDIETLLADLNCQREVRLSKRDVIDFVVGEIGIEVKLHRASKREIYNQLKRYAEHESISCLLLATNRALGLPESIEGKPVYVVSISEGWL